MITVTIMRHTGNRFNTVVSGPKELFELLIILEDADVVKAYKVSEAEGYLVTDLKRQYGWGMFPKFVTEFQYPKG